VNDVGAQCGTVGRAVLDGMPDFAKGPGSELCVTLCSVTVELVAAGALDEGVHADGDSVEVDQVQSVEAGESVGGCSGMRCLRLLTVPWQFLSCGFIELENAEEVRRDTGRFEQAGDTEQLGGESCGFILVGVLDGELERGGDGVGVAIGQHLGAYVFEGEGSVG